MSLKEVQKQTDDWIQQFKISYWNPHEILAHLMEEVGELAREVNHNFGSKKPKKTEIVKELGSEIGDIIFTLACFANSRNIDLDKEFNKVMDKLYKRDNNRYERK